MKQGWILSAVLAIFSLAVGSAGAQEGAKAIFYTGSGATVVVEPPQPAAGARPPATASPPTEPRAKEAYMGIAYWVELVGRDGQKKRVTTDHVFRSGDRITFHIQGNRDGHLYLVNVGSTGRSHLLFPHPAMAVRTNFIRANVAYQIPQNATIRFDENPGEETLLVMLTPQPMGEAAPTAEPATAVLSTDDTSRLLRTAQAKGAKDLLLEVDSTGAQPASYAVAPVKSLREGGMITLQIRLKHQ